MASVNKIILIGNCGADPEVRYLPSGDAVTNVSIATSEQWKDKAGDKQEHTEWHKLSFFGKLAEIAGEYLKKGSPVYVEGRIRTSKWQDKEGQDRYTVGVVVDRMQMLGNRRDEPGDEKRQPSPRQERQPQTKPAAKGGGASFDDMDDDIPF